MGHHKYPHCFIKFITFLSLFRVHTTLCLVVNFPLRSLCSTKKLFITKTCSFVFLHIPPSPDWKGPEATAARQAARRKAGKPWKAGPNCLHAIWTRKFSSKTYLPLCQDISRPPWRYLLYKGGKLLGGWPAAG